MIRRGDPSNFGESPDFSWAYCARIRIPELDTLEQTESGAWLDPEYLRTDWAEALGTSLWSARCAKSHVVRAVVREVMSHGESVSQVIVRECRSNVRTLSEGQQTRC